MKLTDLTPAEKALFEAACEYHEFPRPGKISIAPTKPLSNQRELSLAYSPGVAYPCLAIQENPLLAAKYTSRGNLVGVITNGTAVLGLGDIGPLAGKPVMEGKGCLFKKFAGIDVFDIELAEKDPDKLVEIIAALEPTLGGINLEDIKAPECFYIEEKLRNRLNIPVFHDDQHGTAIISAAAFLNGLKIVNKRIEDVKLAVSGAGAAAIACLDVLVLLGMNPKNIFMCDTKGVVYIGRPAGYDTSKAKYAQDTHCRTLSDIVVNADLFLGCSAAGALTAEMVKTMAPQPIILALANPEPEIRPEIALSVRPDCLIATGRSDYPNQVNNVLCFPFIFRGALDCGATKITTEMKLACVKEIADLAIENISEEVSNAYSGRELNFGPNYFIPTPFDSRLILRIAPAVAKAAVASGVATRPITDYLAYTENLKRFVYQTGMIMRPVFHVAKNQKANRVVFAEGEDMRVLRATQIALEENLARPILIGRPSVIESRIVKANLKLTLGKDFECINPESDSRFRSYWEKYHQLMGRSGITPEQAKASVRRSNTLIASLSLLFGDADAMICGMVGRFDAHLDKITSVIGMNDNAKCFATMNVIMSANRTLFIADTYVNEDPTPEELAHIALLASQEVQRFGVPPKVAFLSHSNFGTSNKKSAQKMRKASELFKQLAGHIESDGEIQGDSALSADIRSTSLLGTTLTGEANLLICPNLDAANILFNVLKISISNGLTVGPILLGANKSVHIMTPSATVRRIVNMTALAVANA
ncbi:MAG: NADP-dependent malic enzyme [Gammaproteobacteria bacterium]|nr:NADP-dependent malic enzyme [Gammaproteobacteria bacterium]